VKIPDAQPTSYRAASIQLLSASIPSYICNIFDARDIQEIPRAERIHTSEFRISGDNGVTWSTVNLANGIYSISQINSAILDVTSTWHASLADPAIVLRANTALGVSYFVIDDTKLIAPYTSIHVNFNPNGSYFGELLGFATTHTIAGTGTYSGDTYARVNWFGDIGYIHIDGFNALSVRNGSGSDIISDLSLQASPGDNIIRWQSTASNVKIPCTLPENRVSGYTVSVKSADGRYILCAGNAIFSSQFMISVE